MQVFPLSKSIEKHIFGETFQQLSSCPFRFLVAPAAHEQSDLSTHCGVCLFVDILFFARN